MRIVSHGLDLIDCARIARIHELHPDRFMNRILTPLEQAYCRRHRYPVPRIAGRFAAKEAILKALGTGWRGPIAWTDIEVLNDEAGKPIVALSGACREIADRLGITEVLLSITHTDVFAAASAIGVDATETDA